MERSFAMGLEWTDSHYDALDEIYEEALGRGKLGRPVRKEQVVDAAMRVTKRGAGSVFYQFGNMTAARTELGLRTLRAIGPIAHRAEKPITFLKRKHCRRP
jgi:hypothetical protein